MTAVYSVASVTALKDVDPIVNALQSGVKRAVIDTGGFAPSWYTWRKATGSSGWSAGVPDERLPVIVRPTNNPNEGAWVSDSLFKVFSAIKPPGTPAELFKEVNKGIEWIATLPSGSTIRYISDGANWKVLFMSPLFSSDVSTPTVTPDELGQFYIYNDGDGSLNAFIATGTTSADWLAL